MAEPEKQIVRQRKHTQVTNGSLSTIFCNTQSLMSKLDELSIIVHDKKPDVIGIVETWLDDSHGVPEFTIDGYNVEFRNRDSKPNRGVVLVYVKSSIKHSH